MSFTDGDLPDQNTKPMLHTSAVPDLVLHVYGLKVTAVKQLNGYDDLNFHIKVSAPCVIYVEWTHPIDFNAGGEAGAFLHERDLACENV